MNLYHIFKFVHNADSLTKEEKRRYASIARAQLSQDELFLIFYNSMFPFHGNPRFLFFVKEFRLMENFDDSEIDSYYSHQEIFRYLVENVNDQTDIDPPIPINPPEKYLNS